MNDSPLAPFLISLASDGIQVSLDDYERIDLVLRTRGKWTRQQLRGVLSALLAHTPEEVSIFRQRFDAFFAENLPVAETITEEHIQGAITELLQIKSRELDCSQAERSVEDSASRPDLKTTLPTSNSSHEQTTETEKEPPKIIYQYVAGALAVILFAAVLLFIVRAISTPKGAINAGGANTNTAANADHTTGGSAAPIPTQGSDTKVQNRTGNNPASKATQDSNTNIPKNNNIATATPSSGTGTSRIQSSYLPVILAMIAVLLILPLFVKLRMKQKSDSSFDPHEPLSFDPQGPRHFSLNKIGGLPSPCLDPATLDDLSKALNYFVSENSCKRLDTKASVYASVRNAGMYTPRFYKLKRLLSVYILEDAYAEPFVWNTLARELATGLLQRGVSVRYGNFYGSLESFQMEDGGTLWFEELEHQRHESLILFFSDGKGLTRRRDGFLLESLFRWSAVAWLDLREKIFWDESAKLIKNFGIPLYQANKDGVTRAMQRFVTEYHSEQDDTSGVTDWQGVKSNTGLSLNEHLKGLTGEDAIMWAQACSMIQPISLGMADALRREYACHLSPEQVERLFRLPNSAWNASGLHFSLPVLSALHEGFMRNWKTQEQEEILEFIIKKVQEKEPPEKRSLRHLTWQWALERARMEVDPDTALESLVKLADTPLGERIKKDFRYLSLPGELTYKQEDIFLRLRPKTARGLLYFQHLSGRTISLNGLRFTEWLRMLWYKALQILQGVRSVEVKFTFEKIKEELAPNDDTAFDMQTITISTTFDEGITDRSTSILTVKNLHTYFPSEDGIIKALNGVSFALDEGELLGLVGESGCGKSLAALSIMRLISPPGEIISGEVWLRGENLLGASEKRMREIRGKRIAMIFQDPMTSLNPFHTVGKQIAEALRLHGNLNHRQAHEAAIEAMREVAIPDPATRVNDYPHQFSGGMRQRIMIAMALACAPEILIADEPTTALDLITQAQILELLSRLRRVRKLSVLLITHDLSLVAGVADRIYVMYTGKVIEEASVKEIFKYPRHPYTQGLLNSVPKLTPHSMGKASSLQTIAGTVPSPTELPPGCHFAPRCPHQSERCTQEPMPLYNVGNRAEVRCVLYEHRSVELN